MRRKLIPITLILLFVFGLSPLMSSAGVGDSWGEADTALLGENRVTLGDGDDYWFYFDADPVKYYQFSIDGPEDSDFYLEIQNEDLEYVDDAYSYSGGTPAYAGYEDGFYIHVSSGYGGGEIIITISEIVPPEHASIETAKQAVLGNNEGSIAYEGLDYYFNFSSTKDQWYELVLSYDQATHMDLAVRGSEYSYIPTYQSYNWESPSKIYFVGNGETIYFVISSWDGTSDFVLTVSEIDTPAHSNQENAQEASLGSNTGTHIANGIPYYFRFLGDSNQWYKFELQSDTTSDSSMNVQYEMRVETTSGFENTYAYGEPPISTVRKGSYTSLYIRVTIQVGNPSEFTLVISEIDAPEHAEQGDAKQATLGENSGDLIAQSIEYWFVFEDADPEKFYAFSVEGQNMDDYFDLQVMGASGDYIDSEYYGGLTIASGESRYYVVVRSYDLGGPFTLTIEETVEPQDIIEFRYNSMLKAGDTFSWEMSATMNGEPANGSSDELPFVDGAKVELEVLKDAPTIDVSNMDYYPEDTSFQNIFEVRVDGEVVDDYNFLPPQIFLLPAEIVLENGDTLTLSEYITMPQYNEVGLLSGIGEPKIVDDEVVMVEEMTQGNETFHYELKYDTFIGHLTYLDVSINTNLESMSIGFTLLDAPDYKPEKPQIFGLPVNPLGVFLALLAIPVIKRKYRQS